ncbi:MAG: SpoIIE family protein phosphatase [Verrucomicrobia bacterium]|nr:SpoIIE family protein phosphatase [Verrucomicrobiota bacterium]
MAETNPKKTLRGGSLARRVLLISTVLLVVPLFIHTALLYYHEYQADIATVRNFLRIVEQGRAELFQEVIDEKEKILNHLALDMTQMDSFGAVDIPFSESGDPFFTRIDSDQALLWIGRNLSEESAIGIPLDLKTWVTRWQYLQNYSYPVTISLKDQSGKIIAGKDLNPKEEWVSAQVHIAETELVIELSVPLRAIQRYEIGYYSFSVLTLILLIGIVGGGAAYLFTRRISRPFEALCRTMERVSEGAVHARYKPDQMGYEINTLGEQFNETLDELIKRTQEAERIKLDRERIAQELKIGREIQLSMLPASMPEMVGLDIAPGYMAALEVSGDFYDLFQIDNHRLLFLVADSAGKGIPACLYSLGFRSALRSFAVSGATLPEIVRKTNDLLLLDTGDSGFFITAWIGLYDTKTKKLAYCSQGHPPALLKRNGKLHSLTTNGIAFGIEPFAHYPIQEMAIQPGDFLLLYTDGIIEAHDSENRLFGQHRLEKCILMADKENSAQFIVELIEEVQQFSQNHPQFDDITLLSFMFSR